MLIFLTFRRSLRSLNYALLLTKPFHQYTLTLYCLNNIYNTVLPASLSHSPYFLVCVDACTVAAPDLSCCMPVLEGHLVREVGQVVGALAVNTCTGAEVCGQPVPHLTLRKDMVENMRSASTEPGTITKASSARTDHSERWERPAGVFISRRQNMVVNPGMEASGCPPWPPPLP